MLDEFSATIDKLYAAAAGHCSWPEALISVEDLTGSAGAVINLIPKSDEHGPGTLAGSFTAENCVEYSNNYLSICPRIRFALDHPGQVTQVDYQFMSEADMDRDPVYHWFGTHGLRYHIASVLADTPAYEVAFSVQRTRKQGHADAEDVRRFNLLKPHLARALSLADQLGTLRSFGRFGSAVLEALPQAVFALDDSGRLRFANHRGRCLLGANDGLEIEGGQLRTSYSVDQPKLDTLISGAAQPIPAASAGWAKIARPSGRFSYSVFVAPIRAGNEDLLFGTCRVLVLVHDFVERPPVAASMLCDLFALTTTEARLAGALGSGHSLESAAALLNMQIATARSHLKAIFAKVGVHRQQDLVRLLTSLSAIQI